MDNSIKFYSTIGKYGPFSNFSRHPITIDNIVYPTSEHYYQSKKFEGTKYEKIVIQATSPSEAAKLGRRRDWPIKQNWEEIKEEVMMVALKTKFTQHNNLKQLLISTNDKILIEHTVKDHYWADGGNGTGKNRLGALLMQLRTELKG